MVRNIDNRRSNINERVRQCRCQSQEEHIVQQPIFPPRNLVLEEDELVGPKGEDQRSADELREEEARGSTSCCGGDNESHSFDNSKESTSEQRHEDSSGDHECLHKNIHQTISDKNLNCVITCVNLQIVSAKKETQHISGFVIESINM